MSNELMMETLNCLTKTFSSTDKKEREQAEKRLKELENDLLNHFKVILNAINEESILSKELRVSVILYIRRMIKNRIEENTLNKESAIEILKHYVELILTNTLTEVCLINLALCLQDLLNFKLVSETKQIANQLVDLLYNYLEKNVGGNIPVYRSINLLLENIIQSASVSQSNAQEILKKMLSITEYMISNVIIGFKSIDLVNNMAIFISHIEICKSIFNFLHTSVMKMRSRLNILNNVIDLYNIKFVGVACELVLMRVPNSSEANCIAFSNNSDFDNSVNRMKSKILQFLNALIGNSKFENEGLVTTYTTLIQSTIETLEFIINNKFNYLQEMNKESTTFPDYNYENLIFQMIQFLSKVLVKSPFIENFNNYTKNFVKSIIIPLLISSKKEIIQMKEDGEEYANYIADAIDDHKSKTIKSVVSSLLQLMSDKYDGFSSFVINYCSQIVDFGIKGENFDDIPQYNLLSIEDRIFKLTNLEFRIETCFFIFCVLTGSVFKTKYLLETVKCLFDTHFKSLISANSDIIKDRLCLFLGIYIDNFYSPDDEQFAICVEYLFINLFYFKENQGVAHKAADSLNDLFSVRKFSVALKDLIGKYFPNIIESIKDIKIGLYFDVILEIVLHINIENCLLDLMKALTHRVLAEIAPYTRIKFRVVHEDGTTGTSRREKNSQYNIIVNKCFNIIRTVADKQEYVTKYILNLEEILEPIFEQMKNPTKIDFDEDIVLIMTSFIKHIKTLPNSSLKILPELPKYLKKSKGLMLDLYELMNQYVVYGNGILDVREEYSKIIMKVFRACFDKKCDYDKAPFLGSALMQVWVQNSVGISQNIVKEVMLIAIDQIKAITKLYKDEEDFQHSSDLYTFISLMVLIYSGFVNYPFITFEAIITNNDVNNFMQWSEEFLRLKFHSSYQLKALIIGICSFLKIPELLNQIPECINKFLNFLLVLLNRQKNEESKSLKTALKKEIQCGFIDSDEEEEDESEDEEDEISLKIQNINKIITSDIQKLYKKFEIDECNEYSNEREIMDICDRTINPIKSTDEYEYFKNSIQYLTSLDVNIWNNWTNSLSDKERINLNNLIHTRRINIAHDKVNANVPRKLLKIKKNDKNNINNETNN